MLVAIVICIILICFIYWLRVLERRRSINQNSVVTRRYRVQDYNGAGKDLVISHDKLLVHPDLAQYEDQFLYILFGEESEVILAAPDRFGRIELRVRVETQATESEEAITYRLKRIGK